MNIEDVLELDCYLSQSFLKKNNIDISIYSDLIVTHNKEYIAKTNQQMEYIFRIEKRNDVNTVPLTSYMIVKYAEEFGIDYNQ